MIGQIENVSKPGPVKQIALIVVPPVPENIDLWCTQMAGMPFIVRQARLVARANVSETWILCPETRENTKKYDGICACIPDHRYAPDLKMLTYDLRKEQLDSVLSTLPEAERYIVFNVSCVYEQKLFTSLVGFEIDDHGTRQVVTSPDRKDSIWICGAEALSEAVKTVSEPDSTLSEDNFIFVSDLPVTRITHHGDIKGLQERIWDQCRKDIDGLVSTWVNRHISLAISRRIVNFSITPNQITVFAILLGILASFIASSGNYFEVLVGASMLQISSIIDGVDGEIARMRVQGSVLGEWLDTIGDDVVNICFVLAIGYGSSISGVHTIWPYLAVLCAFLMFFISAIYYVWLARAGRGDILSTNWFQAGIKQAKNKQDGTGQEQSSTSCSILKLTIFAWATRLFRRDLLIAIIFFTAVAGVVQYSLLIFIPASLATLAAQLVKIFEGKNGSR